MPDNECDELCQLLIKMRICSGNAANAISHIRDIAHENSGHGIKPTAVSLRAMIDKFRQIEDLARGTHQDYALGIGYVAQ